MLRNSNHVKRTRVNKKVSVIVMAILILALVGCSSNSNNNTSTNNTASSNKQTNDSTNATTNDSKTTNDTAATTDNSTATTTEPPMEINWHGNFQLDSLLPDSYVQKIIEEKFNVKINFVSAKMDKLNLLAASGDLPDVMRIADPKDVAALGSSGVLLELPKDLLSKEMPDVTSSIDQVDPGLWGLTNVSGTNYAIPQYLAVVPWDTGMAWRKDVLADAGITTVPQSIADYDSAFKTIKSKEKDILKATKATSKKLYMFSGADIQYPWNAYTWLFGAYNSMPGTWQLDASGNIARGETLPGTRDALVKLAEWYKDGYIDPAFVTDKGDQMDAKYAQGAYAMTTKGIDGITSPNPDSLQKVNPDVQYDFTKAPTGANGEQGVWSWGKRQNFIAFSAKLKDQPEKVNKILEIMNAVATDDSLFLTTHYGEEGKSYKLDNGIPVVIPPYDNDKSPESNALGTGGPNGGLFGPFGSIDIVKKFTNPQMVDAWQTYYAGKPDVLFMLPLPSTASTDQRIQDKWNETFIKIVIGEAPISAYDDFLKWFDANGGKQLTKEANDLYTASFKK
ncbi:type 2 periplasmic-binding domain-containing protein [Paenibacillus albus]|uniref:Extracellular solute-binding protein n=1 Tax=Paenibacillus albus TaxID=2495582 RepID=A0A3Q8X6X5_9BACL|nr:hypothetical protein [Paenibacillus albus]AZN41076.1 hypothetical protein EJC50_16430 [Paenibacillus albus]